MSYACAIGQLELCFVKREEEFPKVCSRSYNCKYKFIRIVFVPVRDFYIATSTDRINESNYTNEIMEWSVLLRHSLGDSFNAETRFIVPVMSEARTILCTVRIREMVD